MKYNLALLNKNYLYLVFCLFISSGTFGNTVIGSSLNISDQGYILILSDSTTYLAMDEDLISEIGDYIDSLRFIEGEEKFDKYRNLHRYQIIIEAHMNIDDVDFSLLDLNDRIEKFELFNINEANNINDWSNVNPRFPGCESMEGNQKSKNDCARLKMLEFIYTNIKYPEQAKKEKIQGMCVISFTVQKNGQLTNIKISSDIGGGCGEESLRLINLMNEMEETWIPGYFEGYLKETELNVPVRFRLE